MKEIMTILSSSFGYGGFTSKHYSRVGSMVKKYGKSTLVESLDSLSNIDESNLAHLLNIAEKKCQKLITNDKTEFDWKEV